MKVESLLWRLEDTLVQWLQGLYYYYSLLRWKISCCSQNSGTEYITSLPRVMITLLLAHMHYDYAVRLSPPCHLDILIFRPVHRKRIKLSAYNSNLWACSMANKQLPIMSGRFVFLYLVCTSWILLYCVVTQLPNVFRFVCAPLRRGEAFSWSFITLSLLSRYYFHSDYGSSWWLCCILSSKFFLQFYSLTNLDYRESLIVPG